MAYRLTSPPSTSSSMSLVPNSVGVDSLPRRMTAVCGSNRLTSLSAAGTASPSSTAVNWTYLVPAAAIGPAGPGAGHVSVETVAAAVLDELEQPRHPCQQVTVRAKRDPIRQG